MDINDFYIYLHIGAAIFTSSIMIYLWLKYYSLSIKIYGSDSFLDYTIFLFLSAILLWEMNLFDSDLKYESYSSIILNSVFGLAMTSINGPELISRRNLLIFSAITLFLFILTKGLYTFYENIMVGYMVYVFYMLGVLVYSSRQAIIFYKKSSLLFIGVLTCVLFGLLFSSIILSLFYSARPEVFNFSKGLYLLSSFGLFAILVSYSFTWFMNFERKVIQTAMEEYSDLEKDAAKDDELINAIIEGKAREAIKKMMDLSKKRGFDISELVVLLAWLSRIESDNIMSTITDKEYRQEMNTINANLLKMINAR